MSHFAKRPVAAAILLLSGAGSALSQQIMPPINVTGTPEGFKTESTSTALGVETPLRDIPQFMNIVPEPVIRQQAITSLQEALRNVPGITFTAAEGGVSASQIFWLRGFPAGGDLFLDARARHRRVQPRPLQHRAHRSPERTVRARVRARLDRRGHQPGHEGRRPPAARRGLAPRRDQWRASRHRRCELHHQPEHGVPLPGAGRGQPDLSRRDPERPDRLRAVVSLRHRHGPRRHPAVPVPADQDQDGLWPAQPRPDVRLRRCRRCRSRQYYGFANYDFADLDTNIATATVNWRIERRRRRCATSRAGRTTSATWRRRSAR